jgi:NodT family efflux transporter outer membrane factor (OMF) lipoprotein
MKLSPAALAALNLLLLSGCMTPPRMAASPEIRAPGSVESAVTFAGPAAAFPGDRWWDQLGDPALGELVAEGLARSPDVASAKARIDAAMAQRAQVHAGSAPSLALEASAGGERQSQNQGFPPAFIPDQVQTQGRIAGDFNFDLDLWGRNRLALAAASSDVEAAKVDAAQARLMLATAIAATYADLNELFARADVAAQALRIARQTEALTRMRLEHELDDAGALRRAESRTARARGDVAALEEAINIDRNALAALLGAGPDRGLRIARPSLHGSGGAGLPQTLPLDLVGRRPDIVSARLRGEAAAARIGVARTDFYPSINLVAVAGLQSVGFGALFQGSSAFTNFGPALRLPIFDGGATRARYRGARADFDIAVAHYDAALVGAFREVADAITRKRALVSQRDSARASLLAGEQARRIAELRYRNGLADRLQLLAAEDGMIAAQQQVATLDARDIALEIALIRALGGGFADTSTAQPEAR